MRAHSRTGRGRAGGSGRARRVLRCINARDLDGLTALLLDTTTLEYPGFKVEQGADAVRAGSLQGTLFGCPDQGYELTAVPRCELRTQRGQSFFLWWSGNEGHAVVRVEVAGERWKTLRR